LIDRRKIVVLPFDWGRLQSFFDFSQQQDTDQSDHRLQHGR
jgi:hypothetical protein